MWVYLYAKTYCQFTAKSPIDKAWSSRDLNDHRINLSDSLFDLVIILIKKVNSIQKEIHAIIFDCQSKNTFINDELFDIVTWVYSEAFPKKLQKSAKLHL